MVLRNDTRQILFSSCRTLFNCRDILEAEVGACMEGLSLALQRTEAPVIIETDSLIAVNLISNEDVDRSIYASLVREVKHLMTLRPCFITHRDGFLNCC